MINDYVQFFFENIFTAKKSNFESSVFYLFFLQTYFRYIKTGCLKFIHFSLFFF